MAGATECQRELQEHVQRNGIPQPAEIGLKLGLCTLACSMKLPQHGPQLPRLLKDQPQVLERLQPTDKPAVLNELCM